MEDMKKLIIKSFLIGFFWAVLFFIIFGAVTSVYKNPIFTRMTPVTWIEWFSLITTSFLLGSYIALSKYIKGVGLQRCNIVATSGGILGFLTFGCSVCNKILILLLGFSGVMTYFEPIRPILGVISFIILLWINYKALNVILSNKKEKRYKTKKVKTKKESD